MRFLLFALFLNSPAFAWQGQLQSVTDFFPVNLAPPTEDLVPRLGIELEDQEKVRKTLLFSFKGTFQSNLVSRYQPESYFGDIQEAYGEYRSGAFKARLGWNTLNWGVFDIYSPMDVVNQHVFFTPIEPEKRGAPMLELQWNPRGWSMSAIYIPWQAKSVLPSIDSRWLPRQSLLNIQGTSVFGPATLLLPTNPQFSYGPDTQLNDALENNFGFNVVKHWSSLDLHLMYFNGAASTPSANVLDTSSQNVFINLSPIVEQLQGTVTLLPLYYRTQTTGIGFSSTLGSFILRGESAYTDSISPVNGNAFSSWYWQSGLGLETNFDLGSSTLTALVNYYRGQFPQAANNLISSHIRLFDDTPALGLRWAFTDNDYLYSMTLYEISQDGLILVVGYHTKLTDSLHWDISWRELTANQPGLIQSYNDDNHADMKLTYYF